MEPPFGRRNPKQKDICKADALFYEGLRQSGYFQVPFKGTGLYAPGLLAGGAGAPYKRFRRRRKPWRRGGFAAPSIEIPEGGGRLRRPEPKKKDMTKGHVFLFGARGGSRTRTPLRALAPEASESTNSTTRAEVKCAVP